jgi:hypothetical protein
VPKDVEAALENLRPKPLFTDVPERIFLCYGVPVESEFLTDLKTGGA